jgi:hypothetical protein
MTALDEQITMLTIVDFVEWCKEGLEAAGVRGEILIVDSGDDRTTELALAHGARVLRTPRRGLGRAYIDAVPHIRGRWVVMGDADCTYDFRQLEPFVDGFRAGFDFVMGSRWKGTIEPGSMPPLHQYLGTPITTKILNLVYSSRFSDIHCGMRGLTLEALKAMDLQSQSWEYASEMVLKSVHMKLRTTEVPVTFLKDREGRVSHHRRSGWFSPWQAAWINLRAMFIHGADFFSYRPGIVLTLFGLLLTVPLTFGPATVGGVTFSLYWMLAGVTLTVLGLQSFFLGCIAQVIYDYSGDASHRWLRLFRYTRTAIASAGLFALGIALVMPLVIDYLGDDLRLSEVDAMRNHMAITGFLAMIAAFTVFTSTLLLHAASAHSRYTAATRG